MSAENSKFKKKSAGERNPGLNYTQADVRLVVRAALAKVKP